MKKFYDLITLIPVLFIKLPDSTKKWFNSFATYQWHSYICVVGSTYSHCQPICLNWLSLKPSQKPRVYSTHFDKAWAGDSIGNGPQKLASMTDHVVVGNSIKPPCYGQESTMLLLILLFFVLLKELLTSEVSYFNGLNLLSGVCISHNFG